MSPSQHSSSETLIHLFTFQLFSHRNIFLDTPFMPNLHLIYWLQQLSVWWILSILLQDPKVMIMRLSMHLNTASPC